VKKISDCNVVDLFCGIGGLSHGFVKENFNIAAGFDIDETCKFAFEKNNNSQFFSDDVCSLSGETIKKLFDGAKIKILVGCAPCQPFSSYQCPLPKLI
jgi:DNA (cytosine-5)-methyltransferase 1